MLEHEVPSGLTYLDCEPLGPPDYEASGYVATYRVDHREVAVAFLIVDLNISRPAGSGVGFNDSERHSTDSGSKA